MLLGKQDHKKRVGVMTTKFSPKLFGSRKKVGDFKKQNVDLPGHIIKIYRFKPLVLYKPYLAVYPIPSGAEMGPMVLDALIYIKNKLDSSLSFRRSCREGICGSCAMNMNGMNGLACLTPIDRKNPSSGGVTKSYPLPHMHILRELIPDCTKVDAHSQSIQPGLTATSPSYRQGKGGLQTKEDREKLNGLYECILCACCSTSCPSY
jgi:succinate dehydrogenase/fumarate reductase iron-sulfur protein